MKRINLLPKNMRFEGGSSELPSGQEFHSDKVTCPHCGFLAHKLCSDGHQWRYVCERCRYIFTID